MKGRNDVTVKMDRALADRVRLVATFRKVSVAELLGELISEPLSRAYGTMLRALEREKERGGSAKG
jgi:hypothetical protein